MPGSFGNEHTVTLSDIKPLDLPSLIDDLVGQPHMCLTFFQIETKVPSMAADFRFLSGKKFYASYRQVA